jgi:GTP cyclohydrolase I
MSNFKEHDLVHALQVLEEFLASRAISDSDRANFTGSAKRVARMYQEMCWEPTHIAEEVGHILKVSFPVDESEEPGVVVQGPIQLNSMCPHHFMPVRYHAYVGYLPRQGGNVLGLSKLARIPEYLSKRFVLQEQLAKDIADAFYDPRRMLLFRQHPAHAEFDFYSDGSIVTLVGVHTCESCRGVVQDARTLVTERRGSFTDGTLEARFYQAIGSLRQERPFGG